MNTEILSERDFLPQRTGFVSMLRQHRFRIFLESGQALTPKALLDLGFAERPIGIKKGIAAIGIENKACSVKP